MREARRHLGSANRENPGGRPTGLLGRFFGVWGACCQVIIKSPSGKIPREDEVRIRNASLAQKIPIMTTLRAAQASANGIRSLQRSQVHVKTLQEYHAGLSGAVRG